MEVNDGLMFRYNRNWFQILIVHVMVDTKKQHKKIKFNCVVVMNIALTYLVAFKKAVLVFQILPVSTSSDLH